MPEVKRLRIFAGPNGSGKSTLFDSFKKKYYPGKFINSDLIEKEISEKGFIDLKDYCLELNQQDLLNYFQQLSAISLIEKSKEIGHEINIEIKENIIVDKSRDTHGYEASLITSFLRDNLLKNSVSFSFESVMSHPSKLEEVRMAKKLGYKVYLYFICLDTPLINVSRVRNRVAKGGHNVPAEKIISRYIKTLDNLYPALKLVDKAYLFDNSDEMQLIAELENQEIIIKTNEENFPNWFIEYLINKI